MKVITQDRRLQNNNQTNKEIDYLADQRECSHLPPHLTVPEASPNSVSSTCQSTQK